MSNSSSFFSDEVLASASSLIINFEAFKKCSDEKQRLLAQLKEKYIINASMNDLHTQVTWYLTNENFLKLIEEHPWLLDKDLGEGK